MPVDTLEKKISIDSFFQNLDEISEELNRVSKKSDETSNEVKSVEVKAFSNENYLQSLLQSLTTQEDIIEKVSSENQQQNTIINNLTNVIKQEGDRVEQIIVNQNQTTNQTTNQISEVNSKVDNLEKIIVNQNQTTNQTTNQISEVGDKVKILEKSGEQVVDQIVNVKKENSAETQELSKAFGVLKQVYDSLSSGVQSVRADVQTISEYLLKDQRQRQELLEQRKLKQSREADTQEKSDIIASLKKAFGDEVEDQKFGNVDLVGGDDAAAGSIAGGAGGQEEGGGLGSSVLAAGGLALGTMGTDAINNMFGTPSQETPSGGGTSGSANLSPTQKQALDILSKYESASAGGYNAVNQIGVKGGRGVLGYSGDFRQMKQHKGRALTDMTIAEIMSLQAERPGMSNEEWIRQGRLHAVGRYQFIGGTLPGVVKRAGIPTTAKFTPEVQDLLAMQYLKEAGIGAWIGPSDKATKEERAIIEKARKEPISYKPSISSGTPQTASGSNPPGALAPGQRPDKALTSEQFNTAQQAREQGKDQGLTGQTLERSVANAVMGTSGATSATGATQQSSKAQIGEPTREIKVSSADLPSPKDMEIASAQPQMKPMDTSSIVPFDTQQIASGGYSQAPQNQSPKSNITSTADSPEAMPTSNPLTRMWTLSAINHLNINGSMDHIYG